MNHDQSFSKRFARGSGSVGTVLAVLVAVLIGYLTFKVQNLDTRMKKLETNPPSAQAQAQQDIQKPVEIDKVKELFAKGNVTLGDTKSKLLFVEFSDPSCPFCHVAAGLNPEISGDRFKTVADGGTYVPPIQEIRKLTEEGKAGFVVLYANGHGNGELAAQALYCAHEKGKFWGVHDLLYTKTGYDLINDTVKNDKANAPQMASFLASAVDEPFMTECLSSGKYAEKIQQDQAKAIELGFGGTPMFLINGERFNGAYSFTDMKAKVDELLAK